MSICRHKIIQYLGPQEAYPLGSFIYLCECLQCGTTIAIDKSHILGTFWDPFPYDTFLKGASHVNNQSSEKQK